LVTEHDGVFRSLTRLAELAVGPRWSEADQRAAHEHWSLLVEHITHCDALGTYLRLLPGETLARLGDGLWALRRQGPTLSEYCRERRVA
jgi:hypothetical protein